MKKPKFNLKPSEKYRDNQCIWNAIFLRNKSKGLWMDKNAKFDELEMPLIGVLVVELERFFNIIIWPANETLLDFIKRVPTLNAIYDEIETALQIKFT